jgi:uncharacterized coiled-coil protein SlyX
MAITRVAIVQSEPASSLDEGLQRTEALTREAARGRATLVVFPETWLPGYPAWLDVCRDVGLWDYEPVKALYANRQEATMSRDPSPILDRLQARVVELETLYAHLERTLADLDQVVLAQRREIDQLANLTGAIEADLSALAGTIAPQRKPEDEKPPHY